MKVAYEWNSNTHTDYANPDCRKLIQGLDMG